MHRRLAPVPAALAQVIDTQKQNKTSREIKPICGSSEVIPSSPKAHKVG